MLIYYFANLQKLYIFSKIEETYVAKVIKIVAATCALNLPLYDMLKGMYYFLGLFFSYNILTWGRRFCSISHWNYIKNGFQKCVQ